MAGHMSSYSLTTGRINMMRKMRSRSKRSLNISASFRSLDPGMNNGKNLAALTLADTHSAFFEPRVAVLSRGKKGFGFVLRGAKSPKNPSIEFVPTKEFPALQYLESVDKGSPADKAGLLRGDFVLEINGEDVGSAPHQQVVHMVVTAPDTIVMKVVTAPNVRGQETLERFAAKHPKKLSRIQQQRQLSSYESDTWSVCSSLGEMDDRDSFIRPEVEIISIGPATPLMPHSAGATPSGQTYQDDTRNWQTTLPSNGIRSKHQRPSMPPPSPNKFNTVARINSSHSEDLRQQAMQASQDRSTAFEVELADGAMSDDTRRYSAGSDSAVSSSRSSPASSYSNTTSSTTSGTDSAVNMQYDRLNSDPGLPKPPAKKSLPPPPQRSSSLPPENPSSYGNLQDETVSSPTEELKSGFAALIATAAAAKTKKPVSTNSEIQTPQGATSPGADHRQSSDMTPFEIAMQAKTMSLRRKSSGEMLPIKPPRPKPDYQEQGSSDLLAAIARRKAKVESQESSDIELKIKNFKNQEGQNRPVDDAPLANALAKRRSTMEQASSDESSESPHGSPTRQPLIKQPAIDGNTSKPDHKPPPPPVKVKEKPPPTRPKVSQKPRPPSKDVNSVQPPSHISSNDNNEPSTKFDSPNPAPVSANVVLPPPAMYNDRSLERMQKLSREHSLDTGSVSSLQSTVSNMSTDPSSSNDSGSVVTVQSISDPENGSNGETKPDENGNNDSTDGVVRKPAAEWTCAEVSDWLTTIKMSVYVNEFIENEISGEHLLTLTKEDLVELGIKKLAHKKDIMKAIEQLS